MATEFEEIGHSGGKITFRMSIDAEGRRQCQMQYSGDRPVPKVLIELYALPHGVPVSSEPVPGCFLVFIAGDSQGKFGHDCPNCGGYWRSGPWPNVWLVALFADSVGDSIQRLTQNGTILAHVAPMGIRKELHDIS